MIARLDAMVRTKRTREAAEHNLRVGPRRNAQRYAVPRVPRVPGAGVISYLDVIRVASVGRLRAKTRAIDGDCLCLLRENSTDGRDLRWAVVGSAARHQCVGRCARAGLSVPYGDREMIARSDAVSRPVRTGEASEHNLRIGPGGYA